MHNYASGEWEQLRVCDPFPFKEVTVPGIHYFLTYRGKTLKRVHAVAELISMHEQQHVDCNVIYMLFKSATSVTITASISITWLREQLDEELAKQGVDWCVRSVTIVANSSASWHFTASSSNASEHKRGGGIVLTFNRFGIEDI